MNSDPVGEAEVDRRDSDNLLRSLTNDDSSGLDDRGFLDNALGGPENQSQQDKLPEGNFPPPHGLEKHRSLTDNSEQRIAGSKSPREEDDESGDDSGEVSLQSMKQRKIEDPAADHHSKHADKEFPMGKMAEAEIISDDEGRIWKPVQLLTTRRNLCWTHFLALDSQMNKCKCKHCASIIESASTGQDRISIVNYRKHLQTAHKIGAKDNYYITSRATLRRKYTRSIINNPDLEISKNTSTDELTARTSALHTSRMKQLDEVFVSNVNSFTKSKLLALVCVAYNFPFNYLESSSFRLLFKEMSLMIKVTPEDLVNRIVEYSEEIDQFIGRCINSIANDPFRSPLCPTVSTSQEENHAMLTSYVNDTLTAVLQVPLFSMTGNVYGDKYFVTSLFYCDADYSSQKCLPVHILPLDKDISATTEIIENGMDTVMETIEPLYKVNYSITTGLAADKMKSKMIFNNKKYSHMNFHDCFVSFLAKTVLPFFGHESNVVINDHSEDISTNRTIIDEIFNLQRIDIYDSIFGKINRFLSEIHYDTSILEHFQDDGGSPIIAKKLLKLKQFNKNYPSKAVKFLRSIEKRKKYILKLNKYLDEESFTTADFEMISVMATFLSSVFDLCSYFTSPSPSFHNIPLALIAIENHIRDALENTITSKIEYLLIKQLESFVEYRKRIAMDDDIFLSVFFSPVLIRNAEFFRVLYPDLSEEHLTKRFVRIARTILRNFLIIEKNDTVGSPEPTDQSDAFIRLPFLEFSNMNDGTVDVDDLLNLLLDGQILLCISDFKKIIVKEYDTYFEQRVLESAFSKRDNAFVKRSDNKQLNELETIIGLHIPIGDSFLKHYLDLEVGVVLAVLAKYVFSLRASSYTSSLSFLTNFSPANKNNILVDILKVRIFDNQFPVSTIIWKEDDLFSICNNEGPLRLAPTP